jgi:hypothetical protein
MWCRYCLLLIVCGPTATTAFILPLSALSGHRASSSTHYASVRLAAPRIAHSRLQGRVSLDDDLFFSGSGDDDEDEQDERAYDDDDEDEDEINDEHVDVDDAVQLKPQVLELEGNYFDILNYFEAVLYKSFG